MIYRKYCKAAHVLPRSETLLVGTLHKFHSQEMGELQDSEEGVFYQDIEFKSPIEMHPADAAALLPGHSFGQPASRKFQGGYQARTDFLRVEAVSRDTVRLSEGRISIKRTVPNAFIFCMTREEEPPEERKPFEEYDASWCIVEEQARQFAGIVGSMLKDQVRVEHLDRGPLGKVPISVFGQFRVEVEARNIEYRDRTVLISSQEDMDVEVVFRLIDNIPFIKPESYSHEAEVRFIFRIMVGDSQIPPANEGILLKLNPLSGLVKKI